MQGPTVPKSTTVRGRKKRSVLNPLFETVLVAPDKSPVGDGTAQIGFLMKISHETGPRWVGSLK
ncbi:MAG TPA: hypothetical protein DD706_13945 [Nitrospiraceae bacterium]|nr:hypothetical protein [Nitrospiraceae bacterium]